MMAASICGQAYLRPAAGIASRTERVRAAEDMTLVWCIWVICDIAGGWISCCTHFAGVLWEWQLELDSGDAEVVPRAVLLDFGQPDLSVSEGQVAVMRCSSWQTGFGIT